MTMTAEKERVVAAIFAKRTETPCDQVVERDVVVAGHDQLRLRQQIEKRTRRPELPRERALREVPGHDEHIGTKIAHRSAERVGHSGVDAPEMEVREVNDRTHQGTRTRSAWRRIRNASGPSSVMISPSSDARTRATPASSVNADAANDSNPSSREMSPKIATTIICATRRLGIPGAMHT